MVSASIIKQRESLPIFPYRQEIIEAIRQENLLVIIGETGSGKTTQIPQYILESFDEVKFIGVTQPRRIAAITVSTRVSEEHGTRLGDEVGYSIRFDDCTSSKTRLRYMTDGVLLREATLDPRLEQYNVIIVDEAHERTLETDVLFGLLKTTHILRPDLKILVMSATLNVEKFSDFFNSCPIFVIPGRTYNVLINHHRDARIISLKSTFVMRAVETALYIHCQESPGDILVFLTGQNEIEKACRDLLDQEANLNYRKDVKYADEVRGIVVYPIYASLETLEQKAVFEDPPRYKRKIIFATNIAQQKSYDPTTGMDALLVVPISQAAATQRAGRAGRTAPGKAYRLYSRESFEQMEKETIPEIQRSSLLGTVLSLKKMGIRDILNFEFIDPPDSLLVKNALKQLFLLEAIDDKGKLTNLGDEMSIFPLSPFLSRVLVASSKEFGCSREVLIIVAMLSVEEIFISPRSEEKQFEASERRKEFYHPSGDHMTLLNIFEAYLDNGYSREWCKERYLNRRTLTMAKSIRDQLRELMLKHDLPITSCRIKNDDKFNDNNRSRKRHRRNSYSDIKYDSNKILEAFSSSYYINLAKRHSHRPLFYHYASARASNNEDIDANSSLLALHISSTSSLFSENKIVRMEDLDWVMYHNVLYTNKALMKVISKVKIEWVEEKLKLFEKLVKNFNIEENKIIKEEEKKNQRLAAVEAARQRAIHRRASNNER
ncbi:10930_t:CDS:2 [Diversispora eburnea]|uniref:RNA helicase n=1 Tax=Diversispora eburnea TaxID=1213867 RepID=A0A9N8VF63_9GLOM|nr:10930_t:CDS:2 [Diversispora eburnea]